MDTISNTNLHTYDAVSFRLSCEVTKRYSTSFFAASRLFSPAIRNAIWSIYGFVRLADEIVDSFLDYDQKSLLDRFQADYERARAEGISLNPILQAFVKTVRTYEIPNEYVDAFLSSMRQDLTKKEYADAAEAAEYIYGSADVVGLMCLKVFCDKDASLFEELKHPAMRLGSAFQKVNFLRDLKVDQQLLGRTYFPEMLGLEWNETIKQRIVSDIRSDFKVAETGIRQLPASAKPAVRLAFRYYKTLLDTMERTPAETLLEKRIRVPDSLKALFFMQLCWSKNVKRLGR